MFATRIAHLRIAHLRIALHVSNPDVGNPMRWDDTVDTIESFQRCGSCDPHVRIRGGDTQHMCGSAEVTDGCWGQTSHLHILLPSCWWLMVGLIYSQTILRQISFKPLKRSVCQNLNVQGHRAHFHCWLLQSSSVKAVLDLLITDDFAQTYCYTCFDHHDHGGYMVKDHNFERTDHIVTLLSYVCQQITLSCNSFVWIVLLTYYPNITLSALFS